MADLTRTPEPDAFTPWAQAADEGDADYQHFRYWLGLKPRPPSIDPALAIRHNWLERAQAHDAWVQLQGLSPREIAANVFRMWSQTTLNETIKWFKLSLTQGAPQLEPQRISEYIDLITDPARNQAQKQTHDLSGLTEEETATLLALLEKVETKA